MRRSFGAAVGFAGTDAEAAGSTGEGRGALSVLGYATQEADWLDLWP